MLVYRFGNGAQGRIYCPITVPKFVSSYFCFKFVHRCDHVRGVWFYIVAKRDVHIRVPKDGPNHFIGNSEPIQIRA